MNLNTKMSVINPIVQLEWADDCCERRSQQSRKPKCEGYITDRKLKTPDRQVIALSGSLEAQVISKRDYTGGSKSDVNLSHAELDVVSEFMPWVTAAMFMTYDDSAPTTGARVTNSQLQIDEGFVTVGDLAKTPWYATVGQIYLPFGQYDNYMVTDPLTKTLARTKDRALTLGYSQNGWQGAFYGYKGDTYTGDRSSEVNSWGANLYYGSDWHAIANGIGVSYIYNVADSIGMMNTADTAAGHFTGFKSAKQLEHNVSAIDLRGSLKYDAYTLIAEYINSLRAFAKTDLSFNGKGARPQVMDFEVNYSFKFINKSSSVAVGYGRTWEALALNLPKHSAFVDFVAEWFKSTLESIEYRHDWNYGKSDTAGGGGIADYPSVGARTRNIVTAQVGVYF